MQSPQTSEFRLKHAVNAWPEKEYKAIQVGPHDEVILRVDENENMSDQSPQAAQLALGHAGNYVTIRHYVQSAGIVSKAIDALPQPAAFVAVDEEAWRQT